MGLIGPEWFQNINSEKTYCTYSIALKLTKIHKLIDRKCFPL